MAANIGGFTVHSWGECEFMKDGVSISINQGLANDLNSMLTKCERMRFCIIDEIENLGARTLSDLEQHTFNGANSRLYKWRRGVAPALSHRYFGGLHMLMFGDFWQLPPVGEVAII